MEHSKTIKYIKNSYLFLLTGTMCCNAIGILHKFSLKDMGILNILLDILQGILYNLSHGNI